MGERPATSVPDYAPVRPLPLVPYWVANLILAGVIAASWPIGRLMDNQLDPYFMDLVIRIGVAIILAASLNLINGITGQFSLGHAGFMGLGAYVCGVLVKHWAVVHGTGLAPPPAVLFVGVTLLAGLVAAAAGLAIGIPTLRLRGDYLAIATLGFGEIITLVINQVQAIGGRTVGNLKHVGGYEIGGPAGLHDIPIATNFFWTFLWCLVCIVTVWRLAHSAKGKAFYAVREDEIAAAAMGVNTTFQKVAAFAIGAFFAGVAGALSATFTENLAPGSFNFMKSIEIVVMVVLGGSGSISGAILAAIVLTWLPEQLRRLENWRLVIYALLLIVMMIVRPEGLLGSRELWFTRRRFTPPPPTADPSAEGL
jgi:branched-chain amino acid transport system permease protein